MVTLSYLTKSISHEIWNTAIWEIHTFFNSNLLVNPKQQIGEFLVKNSEIQVLSNHYSSPVLTIQHDTLHPLIMCWCLDRPHVRKRGQASVKMYWRSLRRKFLVIVELTQHSNTFASPPQSLKVIMQWFENRVVECPRVPVRACSMVASL